MTSDRRARIFAALAIAIGLTACAKQNAATQATASAAPSLTPTPVAAASAAPQAQTSATATPTASPTPTPTATPSPDMLTFQHGAIVRAWPPTDKDYAPASLLTGGGWGWKSRAGAGGPYVFVFEFPVATSLTSVEMTRHNGTPPPSGLQPDVESVRLEGSTTAADSGYSDIGTYQVAADGNPQKFPMTSAVKARWLRATLTPASGTPIADLVEFSAFGTPDDNPANKPLAGTWFLIWHPESANTDPLFASGTLPDPPDWKKFKSGHYLWKIIQNGSDLRGIECNEGGGFTQDIGATQSGASVTWAPIGTNSDRPPGILYPEGSIVVGGGQGGNYIAMRVSDADACKPPAATVGHGKKVLLLTPGGDPFNYYPYQRVAYNDPAYPAFNFIPQYAALFQPAQLKGIDTVALLWVCGGDNEFAKWQSSAFADFVAAGHKLIIHDSDTCTKTGYSFLPYPFTTSNPGARGAHGQHLDLVESSELGSDKSDPAHFVDVAAYAKAQNQDLGDANTVISQDAHWCGHLFGTNVLNQNGFMHMFASYGRGLIIFDGLDKDDSGVPAHQKLLLLELQQRVPYNFNCTQHVSTSFIISPSTERTFTPGVAKTMTFPLNVYANQGYAGSVSLAATAPADAPWQTRLSVSSVDLKGDSKPLVLTIDIPAKAAPGRHEFDVVGTDAKNQTAKATITLSVKKPALESALTKSKRIRIYGIHFDFNSATVRPESGPVIREIADALNHNPTWKLTIEGHTDNVGGAAYNIDLSSRRAAAVKAILVDQYHIATSRLSTVGYGLSRPVAPNDTDAGRALNRRVELVRQ